MKFYKISFQNIKIIILSLLLLSFTEKIVAQDKIKEKTKNINVSIFVMDSDGNALSNVQVIVGEGIIHATTDANGTLYFQAKIKDFVTFSLLGYEKKVVLVDELLSENKVVLKKSKLFMNSEDAVPLPFISLKKRHITGSSSVLTGNQLEMYPSTDIRNTFTGLANGVVVQELQGAPGLSAEETMGSFNVTEKIKISARGLTMMHIIDDIPTDITEMPLDPNEIESATFIKDIVGKSMYGPAGANGIIFIKTKRGRANERIFNANLEYGTKIIDRFPEIVSGADYAHLNNMARINSGLEPLYSEADIAAYARNDPYDMYHPSVNFRKMMLNNSMNFQRANISSSGGSNNVQYFAHLGYNGEGDLYKIGETADYNRLNARSNLDIKINEFIKIKFDFFGGLSISRSPNYGYVTDFTSESSSKNPILSINEFGKIINDINKIPPIAFPVYANNSPELKTPWYAVTSQYGQNPIGNIEETGYYTETGRNGVVNFDLKYDMSSILHGLKSHSSIGFNTYNLLRIGQVENYNAYIVKPSETANLKDTITLTRVHESVDQSEQVNLHDYFFQRFAFYETLSYTKTWGKSYIQSSATYNQSKVSRDHRKEPYRQQTGILTAVYSLDDKYNIQGVLNYAGSSSFSKDERYILSPTIGIGWVISEERFLKNVNFLNYLKLRAETGILGYESFLSPYYYRDDWSHNSSGSQFGPSSANQWFGSATDNLVYRTKPNRIGNPELSWEKRREFNAGIDAFLLNYKLNIEINYYNQLRDGIVTNVKNVIPYVAGISSWNPRFNQNKYRYFGWEVALQYTNNIGKFNYSIEGNATIADSKIEKYDEPNYRYDYQSRVGQPVDAIRGLKYLGNFISDEEALIVPQLYDDVLHKGDLKYEDKNDDGVIDDNDISMIGHSSPRLYYALNAKFSYKKVELSVIGTGNAFYDINMSSIYYKNGWGDDNYSKFVLDNLGGAYPKLTYYKINNNFVTSDFWLTKGGFFKIKNAELALNVPIDKLKLTSVRGIRIFIRGANLFTFTKVKDIDPESPKSGQRSDTNEGLYPLFTSLSGGLKLTF